jgi:hypothetical protein
MHNCPKENDLPNELEAIRARYELAASTIESDGSLLHQLALVDMPARRMALIAREALKNAERILTQEETS